MRHISRNTEQYAMVRRKILERQKELNEGVKPVDKQFYKKVKAVRYNDQNPPSIKRTSNVSQAPSRKPHENIRRGALAGALNPNQFNDKHKGQRGFIIGGGTSITRLKDEGFDFSKLTSEITVGVNLSYRLFTPTYLVFGDGYFWKKFKDDLQKLKCIKIAPVNIIGGSGAARLVPELLAVRRTSNSRQDLPMSFSTPICFVNNSGVAALRISYLLGLNPIYLVGVDLGPNKSGETHFHNEYLADPPRITKPNRYLQFEQSYHETIRQLKKKNVQVYSCSDVSPLNQVIPYVELSSLF